MYDDNESQYLIKSEYRTYSEAAPLLQQNPQSESTLEKWLTVLLVVYLILLVCVASVIYT